MGVLGARLFAVSVSCLVGLCAGCAFDVIHLKQLPAQFEAVPTTGRTWILPDNVKVRIASGRATLLKKNTTWRQVGKIKDGDVLKTADQVVAVGASNQFEAYPVIDRGKLVGFFLPVQQSFTPADPPVAINLLLKD
jgi:hypothetical protein